MHLFKKFLLFIPFYFATHFLLYLHCFTILFTILFHSCLTPFYLVKVHTTTSNKPHNVTIISTQIHCLTHSTLKPAIFQSLALWNYTTWNQHQHPILLNTHSLPALPKRPKCYHKVPTVWSQSPYSSLWTKPATSSYLIFPEEPRTSLPSPANTLSSHFNLLQPH